MKRPMLVVLAVCLSVVSILGTPACRDAIGNDAVLGQRQVHSSEHLNDLPGLSNVGRVAPGIYRGAQPKKEGYATLKALGIRTVVDLRTTENERTQVEAAGMKAVAVPIRMSRDGLREKVDRVVAIMADPANQPVYVHCRHGQDRTGIVVAAYRLKQQGWTLAEAEQEMHSYGFNNVWVNFKKFIRRYAADLHGTRNNAADADD